MHGHKKAPKVTHPAPKRSVLFAAVFCELSESFFNAVRVGNLRLVAQEADGAGGRLRSKLGFLGKVNLVF